MLPVLLFLHVVAVVMLFSGLALELAAFLRLHRAVTLSQARAATLNLPSVGPLMMLGTLLLLGAGIAMVYVGGFGWEPPWISITFVLVIILTVNGSITNGKGGAKVYELSAPGGNGPITPQLEAARSNWFLNYSVFLTACELLAAVFMMTTKPELVVCIGAVVVAALLPLILVSPLLRRSKQPA